MLAWVLSILVLASLGIGLVRRYLGLNKLWLRKHDKSVAESISVAAILLSIATSSPFLIKNALRHDYKGTANELTFAVSNAVMLLIGIGLWVPNRDRPRFWTRLRTALRLERKESRDLVKTFLEPRAADRIVDILHRVATIDAHLDEREIAEIRRFATAWGVAYDPVQPPKEHTGPGDYVALRQSVVDYLALGPPPRQVVQLRAAIDSLTKVDGLTRDEEKLAIAELFGLIDHHVTGERPVLHRLVIVPQSPAQEDAVRDLLPEAKRTRCSGGDAFVVGSYYSAAYAEMLSRKYRALPLLAVVLSGEDAATQAPPPMTEGAAA